VRIYLAGPLFTQGEWMWNAEIARLLRIEGVTVLLPQERSIPMIEGIERFDPKELFDSNVKSIETCDALVAILDQADPDSGTAWECGYAFKLGKPILGLRSDFRTAGDDGNLPVNLMIARSCTSFIVVPISKRADTQWAVEQILDMLDEIIGASQI